MAQEIPPEERVRYTGRYTISGTDILLGARREDDLRRIPMGCEGTVTSSPGEAPGVIHVLWDEPEGIGTRRIDADCVELAVSAEDVNEAVASIQATLTEHLEKLTAKAEEERKAKTEWTLVQDADGDWHTECPCGVQDEIYEVDAATRWNSLRLSEDGKSATASTGNFDFEGDGYICSACFKRLDAPDDFEVTDWY